MQIAFYVYTMFVIFVCVAACTMAGCSFLLSKNRIYACAALLFVTYAFDLALIFANEHISNGLPLPLENLYEITQPEYKTIFALTILECAWLIVCLYIDKMNPVLVVMPAIFFLIASFLIVVLMEEGQFKQWCFYSIREAFLIWIISFVSVHYFRSKDSIERMRLRRCAPLFIVGCIFVLCIIAENILLIFVWHPGQEVSQSLLPLYISERNFSENFLILTFAVYTIQKTFGTFSLRSEEVPHSGSQNFSNFINSNLAWYCKKYGLTARERDILRLTLNNKDYQNIASELQLAVGTVKSHTHNILKKTGQSSRKDLIRDFWKE